MKSYSLRLMVGLLAFFSGIGVVSTWFTHPSPTVPVFSRDSEEDHLAEVVFRHRIDESQRDGSHRLYFLLRGESTDPTDEFMWRFQSHPFPVKKGSQGVKVPDGVEDKETKERGLVLSIHRIRWASDSEAQVSISEYAWAWGHAGYSCRVVREKGKWNVKGCEHTFVT